MEKKVTKIEAKKPLIPLRKNVCGYARVSSGKDAMLHSLSTQVSYFSEYIQSNPKWNYAGVYVDEAVTGTKDSRAEFRRMIEDCRQGKIDIILTKSISRFARNTVTLLETVRELKQYGVDVYFEKENIWTFDGKGELLLTIMASLAQEESRNMGENITWALRKRYEKGDVIMAYSSFLGYERGEDGTPRVVESEAKIVRRIYKQFLEGKSPSFIARKLTEDGIPTPRGNQKWSTSTVTSILKNEKYKGDALFQKTYTADFLSKTKKVNKGELPKYYTENSHPPIVSREVYDLVQLEFKKRKNTGHRKSTASCFSGMIFCGDCGGLYGSKVWHSTSKYKKTIWQCNSKFETDEKKKKRKCKTPHLTEEVLKDAFVSVFNDMVDNKEETIDLIESIIADLLNTEALDEQIEDAKYRLRKIADKLKKYIDKNSRVAIKQDEYKKNFNELSEKYDAADAEVNKLENDRIDRIDRSRKSQIFLEQLREEELIPEFDEGLFCTTVERITVYGNKLRFLFKNGIEMEYDIK